MEPITAAKDALGIIGFMNALFGFRLALALRFLEVLFLRFAILSPLREGIVDAGL
ncbi:MAG TPA: hypothetical protein VI895_12820 [Bdellovibrionota bacterium]|nr:hypothetical protein [Bdellovibrionota bacterium]